MTGPAMENAGDLIASDRIEGTAVYDRGGERLGHISTFMVERRSGQVRYAILSFGGFLGLGNDHYPIPWQMLDYDKAKSGYVVDLTKETLDSAPRYLPDTRPEYDDSYGRSVFSYYGLIYPW